MAKIGLNGAQTGTPGVSRIFPDFPRFSRIFPNFLEFSRISPNFPSGNQLWTNSSKAQSYGPHQRPYLIIVCVIDKGNGHTSHDGNLTCMCGVMQEPSVRRRVARESRSYPKGPLIGSRDNIDIS
jgi:hypothetical protein